MGKISCTEQSEISHLLEQQEPYIRKLAYEILRCDQRIDDLIQLSRIKLWQAARARPIANPRAYIRCVVKSAYVEIMRQKKTGEQLPVNEEGELTGGQPLFEPGEEMRDPLDVIEAREAFRERLNMLVDIVITLPPRQRRAFICRLKDRIDDPALLAEACRERDLDIESERWPADKIDKHNLEVSYIWANKKIKKLMQDRELPCETAR
ncbi:MAG TPA: sigma-70 family RNA polymerase sigma factor [Ktedonobacteraceae bacterium]|nr:sigma-70 family RNA polymerase sigma factor [Ktedonobacteraceae bacterium]